MIQSSLLAIALDPYAQALREKYESEFCSIEKDSYAAITNKLFTHYGEMLYPDATFTLRLSYRSIKGYQESGTSSSPLHYL